MEKIIACLKTPPVAESRKMELSNGNCENGLKTSEERRLTEPFLRQMASATRLKAKWNGPVVLIVFIVFIISNTVTAFGVYLTQSSHSTTTVLSCPSKWVGYEGKCYYFSESEGTWDSCQSNCSASGASLVAIEDQKEMSFLMQYKKASGYWIGLKRNEGQSWELVNGSLFNGWFEIGADGFCAYLNDEKASSTWCSAQRNWICSKSIYTERKLSEDIPTEKCF